ncbi:MAG: GTPase RsgA, partial [Planctomycetota bacterium]
ESEKGRHTTTLARQFRLECGGYVIDTPGVRSFELWNVEPGELEAYFTEFVPLISDCRFNDCHHVREEGCAVIAAVEAGRISARRYASYVKILEELAREPSS